MTQGGVNSHRSPPRYRYDWLRFISQVHRRGRLTELFESDSRHYQTLFKMDGEIATPNASAACLLTSSESLST